MSVHYQTAGYSMPISVPGKGNAYPSYSQYSMSPPECDDAASSVSGAHSYSHAGLSSASASSAAASYYLPGSAVPSSTGADFDSAGSASGIDFQDYMQDRLSHSFNPIPLDRSTAVQAQSSGKLNAKHRELMDLQRQAQARLARTRERFQEGMRDAREVRGDLEWTQKKVSSLNAKASRMHPKEYAKARARFPSPEC
ncbi:putative domain KxDL [Cordyceps fumosorosea ARSEF 2679]|uniref:Biogenesis of lysosome-related organelles complex 1 subunit KXD1 n=1 Tax=Cordyceps fumosorosea (strain ARSEF 2679) TaxID=1081104 RepID=A0A167VXD1_CORFA|nr:putative domain KxDL [Cordyceps fumosorosea ARSEF 2679]OAA63083.1 putative domain KxDL [Cordyceps fumosorosea ARSEF 2679]